MAVSENLAFTQEYVTVVFSVDCGSTCWGESLCVVGASTEIGSWDPEEALPLATSAAAFPTWRSNTVHLAVSKWQHRESLVLTYKYIIDRCAHGLPPQWEDNVPNREVRIPLEGGSAWLVSDALFNDSSKDARLTRLLCHTASTVSTAATESDVLDVSVCADALVRVARESSQRRFEDVYTIVGEAPLGQGGFSIVWRCRPAAEVSDSAASRFAVKQISKTKTSGVHNHWLFGSQGFEGEIALHQSLDHPNVVKIIDVFNSPNAVSMVLERCVGGDLLELVSRQRVQYGRGLPEPVVRNIAKQLMVAVAYLHKVYVVHRDIKCENLLQLEPLTCCSSKATFKLADFGLAARLKHSKEVLMDVVGSQSTAAPEVVHGRHYSFPADMWSSGATLFTTLAARRFVRNCITKQARLMSGASICSAARDFLTALTRFQPEGRPSSAEACNHPWLACA